MFITRNLRINLSKLQKLCLKSVNKSATTSFFIQTRHKKDDSTNLSSLFKPVAIKPNPDDINVGAELTGTLNKTDLLKLINKFYQRKEIKALLRENGLDSKSKVFVS